MLKIFGLTPILLHIGPVWYWYGSGTLDGSVLSTIWTCKKELEEQEVVTEEEKAEQEAYWWYCDCQDGRGDDDVVGRSGERACMKEREREREHEKEENEKKKKKDNFS